MCLLRAKNLLNSNDSRIRRKWNLQSPNSVRRTYKTCRVRQDVQPSNLNSQQTLQGIISNPLTLPGIESPPPFSVYTRTPARIINTKKDPLCSPLPINLVTSQLTQLENMLCGKMAMKSYLMDELLVYMQKLSIVKTKLKIRLLLM